LSVFTTEEITAMVFCPLQQGDTVREERKGKRLDSPWKEE